ncbi:hypothetical protein SUSAZ_09825 [Sulfolobus acidocaldarius SUSAZ]|nr:hypothetical protein SUSAZ_09825 [Sulfolobus acidocaldarius SUSAZ]
MPIAYRMTKKGLTGIVSEKLELAFISKMREATIIAVISANDMNSAYFTERSSPLTMKKAETRMIIMVKISSLKKGYFT